MFDGLKAKWRQRHPGNPYDLEGQRIAAAMAKLEAGSDEYAKAQNQLQKNNQMRKEYYESRRRFLTISDRGGILKKLIGGGITIGGLCLLSKYEADGNMFTGEKKTFADGFVKTLGRFFGGGD